MFRPLIASILALALSSLALAQPLTTSFTFQGELKTAGSPAAGLYDARFRLYDAATGGTQLGPTLCSDNLSLSQGVFTTQLDFGSQFTGQQRFLEIDIRQDTGLNCSNASGFVTLTPRQLLTAAPNAIYSLSAAAATNATQLNGQPSSFYTNAANLSGALPSTSLAGSYTSTLNLSNTSNLFTGSFSGSGAGLTNLPWTSLVGAPNVVLLQTTVGVTQPGYLTLTGRGTFGNGVSIGTTQINYTADIGGNARVQGDGSNGEALRIGSNAGLAKGLTTEVGSVLNLDLNFRTSPVANATKSAAIRLDGRGGLPAIQFITRPASTATEITSLTISDNGGVAIGEPSVSTHSFHVRNTNTTGVTMAGFFQDDSPNGIAVNTIATGLAMHAGSSGNALLAETTTTTATQSVSLWGVNASTTNLNWAVYARAESNAARVLEAFSPATTGSTYGVIGAVSSPAGFGVYSNGNTGASGTKSFRIDHPDDPANKYLLHYSSESPEVINFYRGTITLDGQGEAEVPLPPYFSKINKDPSYQLTAIGAPMPLLHVSRKIDAAALAQGAKAAPQDPAPACSFHIAGGAPNAEVCWRVEATRNDRWTQTHGAPVELAKQGIEKGTYQDPALYNQPQESGTFFSAPK